jgi:hypothetical protein
MMLKLYKDCEKLKNRKDKLGGGGGGGLRQI